MSSTAGASAMLVSPFHKYIHGPALDFEKPICDVLLKRGQPEGQLASLRPALRALTDMRSRCGPPSGMPARDNLYRYYRHLCAFEAFVEPLGGLVAEAKLAFQWTDTLTPAPPAPGDLQFEKACVLWQMMASEAKEALRLDMAGSRQETLVAKVKAMKRAWGASDALLALVQHVQTPLRPESDLGRASLNYFHSLFVAQTHALQMEYVEDLKRAELSNRETGPSNKETEKAYLEVAGFALQASEFFDATSKCGLAPESLKRFPWQHFTVLQRHYFLARACEAKAETFTARARRIGEGSGEAASWYLVAEREVQSALGVLRACDAARAAKACETSLDGPVIDRTLAVLATSIASLARQHRSDAETVYSEAVYTDWRATRLTELCTSGPVDPASGTRGPHVKVVVR